MRSYQITAFGEPLAVADQATPSPTGRQVLLRVSACGVCHSDVHLADGYFDLGGGRRVDLARGRTLPLTLGHEIAGEVVAVGPEATETEVGARRVVYPWIGCGDCRRCREGLEHLCGDPRALGVVADGGFADHVLVPDPRYLFDLGGVDERLAATYACSGLTAYGALDRVADAVRGRSLLVVGAGGVGLAALALAPRLTETEVIVADIDAARRTAAREAGAVLAVDPRDDDATREVRHASGGGVAAAVDFVGAPESAGFATRVLDTGGRLVVVGLFGGSLPLSLPLLPLRQLTIEGSYVGSPAQMAALAELVRDGRVPAIPVTERSLAEAQHAIDDLRHGRGVGRTVLRP